MKKTSLTTPTFNLEKVTASLHAFRRYSFLVFLLLVGGLYGFVLLHISSLANAQPSQDAISSQVQAAQLPKIDEKVIGQLKSLQDNSVNVKSLFNQSRSNPFLETDE